MNTSPASDAYLRPAVRLVQRRGSGDAQLPSFLLPECYPGRRRHLELLATLLQLFTGKSLVLRTHQRESVLLEQPFLCIDDHQLLGSFIQF